MKRNYRLIPYTEVDGIHTFKDSEIRGFYGRMKDEGTAGTMFVDGSARTAQDFLVSVKFGEDRLYVVTEKGFGPVALVWLNGFRCRYANLHFCFFKEVWGERSLEVALFALQTLLYLKDRSGTFVFDMFLGIVAKSNVHALNLVRRCAPVEVGGLPYAVWDEEKAESLPGIMFYYTRECYENL